MERSFKEEVKLLELGDGDTFHGEGILAVTKALLQSGVSYVGLVASKKRGATVRDGLFASGVPHVDRLRYPAGLDLGGRSPEEVALSILGEIVQLGAQAAGVRAEPPASSTSSAAGAGATAVDPVCRMDVAVSGATQPKERR